MTDICMLAAQFEEKRIKEWPVIVEPKLDGIRTLVNCGPNGVTFMTRNSNPLPSINHLAEHFAHWSNLITFDGECTVAGEDFTEGSGRLRRQDEIAIDAVLTIFDAQIFGDCLKRREFLEQCGFNGPIRLIEQRWAYSFEEIQSVYHEYRELGYEGAIVKIPSSEYLFRRHWSWMKIKHSETFEVTIFDVFEGKGKYEAMLGGFWCRTPEGGTVKVGGGFSDAQRSDLWLKWFSNKETRGGLLGAQIEVEAQEKSKKQSLRHPRFLRFRDDK